MSTVALWELVCLRLLVGIRCTAAFNRRQAGGVSCMVMQILPKQLLRVPKLVHWTVPKGACLTPVVWQ